MENESIVLLSVPCTQQICESNTHVVINEKFNRRRHHAYDQQINANWDKREIIGKIPLEEIKMPELNDQRVVRELYDSILREVVDEVNVPISFLSQPNFIGVAQNISAGKRPSSEFIISCSLSSTEVRDLYNKGSQEEAEESTHIQFVDRETVLDLTPDTDMWSTLAPSAKGCIMLYKLHN
nr:uridine diphosphate glucose pyrophosphatase NUDT22 isoform X3 [Crassostrea gigas]